MFFANWADIVRVLVVGTLAYAGLVLLLRISGKRTLSKMNAFDLVVTVALGSSLASTLLSKEVALATGIVAFVTLVALQFIVAWLSSRIPAVSRLVKAEPALLFYDGCYLQKVLKSERVTEGEVLSAIRAQGIASLQEVLAVVLETDGTFTVVKKSVGHKETGEGSSLRDVSHVPE